MTPRGNVAARAPKSTSIVLADDHAVVRQGLRALLDAEPGLTVVGEAADGLAALDLVEKLRPAVLVVDLIMPGLGGLDVTRRVSRRRVRKTHVVILSMHANEAYLIEALQNGASAYVRKDASAVDLIRAIHEAAAGRRYLSPPFSDQSIEAYLRKANEPLVDSYQTLTAREREVFHLAAEGLSNAEVAERLFISKRTVETHRGRIHRKLGVHGQADIIRVALARGILLLEERTKP